MHSKEGNIFLIAAINYEFAEKCGCAWVCILSLAGNAGSIPDSRMKFGLYLNICVCILRPLRQADLLSRGLCQVFVTRCDNNHLHVQ